MVSPLPVKLRSDPSSPRTALSIGSNKWKVHFVSATLTSQQKRLIQGLLKVGRWNNESEIIRYGLHLVAREVETDQRRALEPYPPGLLAQAYRELTPRELEEDRKLGRACLHPAKGELD